MKTKIFFSNFQILGPLGCQGWVVIPQNVKKKRQNHCPLESMLPRAWKRFSVEIEGSKVDDEADEEEDGGLRGERGCVDKVRGGNISSFSWSRDLLTFFVTLLFIGKKIAVGGIFGEGCLWLRRGELCL